MQRLGLILLTLAIAIFPIGATVALVLAARWIIGAH